MTADAALLGLLLLTERFVLTDSGSITLAVVRALILLKITNLLFQIEIFMRTDVYALYALATRSRNLWATKGAVARNLLHRATPLDRRLLASTSRREIRWAMLYLLLYVPGVAWATWYLVAFGLPSIARIAELSLGCHHRRWIAQHRRDRRRGFAAALFRPPRLDPFRCRQERGPRRPSVAAPYASEAYS